MGRDCGNVAAEPPAVILANEMSETWLRPSPRLSSMRRAQVLASTGIVAVVVMGIGALYRFRGAQDVVPVTGLVLVGLLVAGVVTDRFLQRRIRSWSYCEREDDLLVRRGVLVQRLSVIPYGRMQFIDVVAGPVERFYRLATVRMHTAAAFSDARIPGLPEEEAARLRDHLATLGEAKAAGI